MIEKLNPKVIFEIGVGNPGLCRTRAFMRTTIQNDMTDIVLFEPHPDTYAQLKSSFGHMANVTIHNIALFDRDGEIDFSGDGDSSYINEVKSPTLCFAPEDYIASRKKLRVKCSKISHYDHGQIDVALIDTEGCEWRILKEMVSRPKLLVLETHNETTYQTPDLASIEKWMTDNGYAKIRKEVTDTWYLRNDVSLK